MGDHVLSSFVTIATAIVGVAIIAVLVSNRASTGNVITAAGNAFSGALTAATNPFSGGSGISSMGFAGGGASPLFIQ